MPITPKAKLEQIEIGVDEAFDLDFTHEVLMTEKSERFNHESKKYERSYLLTVLRRGL